MTTREALLRAVLADPAEDTPRLALADWLDENGCGYHAALIRHQVETRRRHWLQCFEWDKTAWRWSAFGGGTARVTPDLAGGPYTRADGEAWAATLPPPAVGVSMGICRGFVDEWHGPAADWVAHGGSILAAHPVRKVTLTTWPEIHQVNTARPGMTLATVYVTPPPHAARSRLARAYGQGIHAAAANALAEAWPGVAFKLPSVSPLYRATDGATDMMLPWHPFPDDSPHWRTFDHGTATRQQNDEARAAAWE